jgi:hypothetical protein
MVSKTANAIRVFEDAKTGPIAWSSEGCPTRQILLVVLSGLRRGSATDMKVSTDPFIQ